MSVHCVINHDIDNNKPQGTGTPLKELHIVAESSAGKCPRRLRPLLSSAILKLLKWVLIPAGACLRIFSYFSYPAQLEDLRGATFINAEAWRTWPAISCSAMPTDTYLVMTFVSFLQPEGSRLCSLISSIGFYTEPLTFSLLFIILTL